MGLTECLIVIIWVWVKITPPGAKLSHQVIAGVGPCFRLPRLHLGYLFLTHSQAMIIRLETAVILVRCPTEVPQKQLVPCHEST